MITDYYKKPLTVGTRVAFNYQGYVRLGTIVKIKTNKDRLGQQYPAIYGNIFVVSHNWCQGVSVESKVKNIQGIVSLDE